jgi:hypothetical protein
MALSEKLSILLFCGLLVVGISGCGGGNGDPPKSPTDPLSPTDPAPPPDPGASISQVSGVLYAPNGSTPIPYATVFIPETTATASIGVMQPAAVSLGETICSEPSAPSFGWTCTDAGGKFTLDLPPGKVAGDSITVKAEKDAWSYTVNLTLTGALADLIFPPEVAPRIAVVTGEFDSIETLLARFGLGEITTNPEVCFPGFDDGDFDFDEGDFDWFNISAAAHQGHGHRSTRPERHSSSQDVSAQFFEGEFGYACLEPGTERFSLYEGYSWGVLPDSYPSHEKLFEIKDDGSVRIDDYDIVYVNCGADTPVATNWDLHIREYVNKGGLLYATDLSSPFVTIPFEHVEEVRNFSGNEVFELGGLVKRPALADWLNEVDCEALAGGSCINADDEIRLFDFAPGWHLLQPTNTPSGDMVETMVEADVSPADLSISPRVRPVTLRFTYGEGVVIFTSYHTVSFFSGGEGFGDATGYLPQERILEFFFHSPKN